MVHNQCSKKIQKKTYLAIVGFSFVFGVPFIFLALIWIFSYIWHLFVRVEICMRNTAYMYYEGLNIYSDRGWYLCVKGRDFKDIFCTTDLNPWYDSCVHLNVNCNCVNIIWKSYPYFSVFGNLWVEKAWIIYPL